MWDYYKNNEFIDFQILIEKFYAFQAKKLLINYNKYLFYNIYKYFIKYLYFYLKIICILWLNFYNIYKKYFCDIIFIIRKIIIFFNNNNIFSKIIFNIKILLILSTNLFSSFEIF